MVRISNFLDQCAALLTEEEGWSLDLANRTVRNLKVEGQSLGASNQNALLTRLAIADTIRKTKKTKSCDVVTAAGTLRT